MFKKKAGVATDNQVVLVMTAPAVILMIIFVAIPLVMVLYFTLRTISSFALSVLQSWQ